MLTLAEYLAPDPSLRPPVPTPRLWAPPAPTRATLLPPLRSRGAAVGSLMHRHREHVFSSGLERTVGYVLATRYDTADLWDQPPAVDYVDDKGVFRRHTFDWRVIRTDRMKVAVAVKPAKHVERSGIQRVIELCAEQISREFADEILLLTETDITAAEKFNADLIHDMKRMSYPGDEAKVNGLITDLKAQTTVGCLVRASGLKAWGFGAVVRAIADRRLRMVASGRIGYDTVVRRAAPAVRT